MRHSVWSRRPSRWRMRNSNACEVSDAAREQRGERRLEQRPVLLGDVVEQSLGRRSPRRRIRGSREPRRSRTRRSCRGASTRITSVECCTSALRRASLSVRSTLSASAALSRARPIIRTTTSAKSTTAAQPTTTSSEPPCAEALTTSITGATSAAAAIARIRARVSLDLGRCRLRDRRHRGVKRGGAPQQVVDDPPSVEQIAGVVAAVEQNPAVDRVGGEHGDDRADHHVVGGAPPARADRHPHGDPEDQDVPQRVGDRNQLGPEVERVVVRVGRHQEDPRQQRQADRDDRRVDQARPVPSRVAAPDQQQQPRDGDRIDREIDGIGDRRERQRSAEERLVVVGEHVAGDEQRQAQRDQIPRHSGRRDDACARR